MMVISVLLRLHGNWIKSVLLYVKDFLDEGETVKGLLNFNKILKNKSDWLCEYNAIA